MGDLRPIGSEKLTGEAKLKRIMEIARFNETIPNRINETAKSEYSVGLSDGNKYEIVKERQGYIIKRSLNEGETEYIEPMKNRKYYSSYSQALKRLNLVAGELNRITENEEGTALFGEQKKYTLKTPKPKMDMPEPADVPSAPPAVPSPELPPSPVDDMGGEDLGMDDMNVDDMGVEDTEVDVDTEVDTETDSDEMVTFKSIQKLTGKLTQKIRTLDSKEGMTSEDIKYVINMVLSSFDLNELTEEDRDDILSKFEEDTEDLGGDDMGGEDLTDDSEVEDIQADLDVPMEGEIDEDMYGSFGNMKRGDYKGDNYYDENNRRVRDSELYGISGDDFDTEEFDSFQKLYDKYGDKQKWFDEKSGEKMFNTYKEKTGKPFKVKTKRPMESEFEEGFMYDDVDEVNPDDFEFDEFEMSYEPKKSMKKFGDYGNGAILDSIFSESKVDKVLSKYFEISKKEILESKQKNQEKRTQRVSEVRQKMKSVVKLTETIEQELASQKFLEENINAKIVGKTNKNNLVFENKGKEVKITPEGLLI